MQSKATPLPASLHAFMKGLIDYAGLFPPASLSLPEALALYSRYRQGAERWMLARFIVPARQLAEVSELAGGHFDPADPFPFAVLGRGGSTREAWLAGLDEDLAALARFRARHGAAVVADLLEVRLPAGDEAMLGDCLAAAAVAQAGVGGLTPFYEATVGDGWEGSIGTTIRAIAAHDQGQGQAGFKLRCGGVVADAFPTSAQVAFAIAACREAGVALKATAGLHHPLRHFNAGVGCKMHGFLNVFGAGMLARLHALDEATLQEMLEDEEAAHFTFGEDGFCWQGLCATTEQLNALRARALLSYGSCSFDEPRDDLQALGLLRQPS